MLQKKICMLGAFSVGKTSLVQRFVRSIYSEKYLTTVGVKIDKKIITVDDRQLNLILWDVEGASEVQRLKMSYLRGAAGYLIVIDGTRRDTLDTARDLIAQTRDQFGVTPFILVVNKSDLKEDWELADADLGALREEGWIVLTSSAKLGTGVEEAFLALGRKLLKK